MSEDAEPRSLLESFDNRSPERDYTIQFTLPEFTCLCPRSGFPDFAVVHVRYVPGPRCVELKSLKMYVNAFRNVGVFHEDVVNGILSDLVSLLAPRYCEVIGDFNVRGNIKTVVRATHRDPGFGREPDGWWTPRDEHSATF
ncbi:MAG: NADPH-dependent 7-cyano-7-deazaguanine reductase QueF [Candidatus Dormibacteraeota bacterium]|uniref:NADPH-dependent 7-cyano-7-deazaguanine reductase n=1 Tax=Candidatus Aeolococcus gillhamiae TaxID=3127015 RepID=A0A2W5Z9F2_9BACT|nr:NADPH-dependent 7-cyano-7-deazaguanine reductase QueF [Candidatus Dormibacteraeota bacterium]PZR81980.1 MAG: NADPH-dependent 7-cyano-7-deazaguanine reductase QueF [Candidatus Dormibacter sp. RRmetagenome_bin12]